MNIVSRSAGNAFRNKVRSGAVIAVLAVAIGLALSMLVANQAVATKIAELKASTGNALTVNPAGARGFQGGGEPLTASDAATVASTAHVSQAIASLSVRLSNEDADSTAAAAGPGGRQQQVAGTTSLESAVDAGTLGNRMNQGQAPSTPTGTDVPEFVLPVTATGVSAATDAAGGQLDLSAGEGLTDFSAASTQAVLGADLAEKNSLTVGDTFTALERKFTVTGIFDAGTEFDNNTLYFPLAAVQELSGQDGEVSMVTALVDSIDNVDATKDALAAALGEDRADVTSGGSNLDAAVESLAGVQKISLIGFIASLVTAGVIILLIMVLIVRERRREIGVLKAIGAPNRTIGAQFVLESLVLVAVAAVLGTGVAVAASGSIAGTLVSSSTSTTTAAAGRGGPAAPGGAQGAPPGQPDIAAAAPSGDGPMASAPFARGADLVGQVTANIGTETVALGLLAVFAIAALGALVPALLTAKIRPIEVLRGE
ncbi:ABC transporter permease [Arthrobacter sp. USHLN218]|uniref:ABC transporter permease n=1 Tax=Arthrobacter sp. USHLN218 TaxID=3081232 RepID=UPI0030162852